MITLGSKKSGTWTNSQGSLVTLVTVMKVIETRNFSLNARDRGIIDSINAYSHIIHFPTVIGV